MKILAVCGMGLGTSLILRMNVEKALKQLGIDADVEVPSMRRRSSKRHVRPGGS